MTTPADPWASAPCVARAGRPRVHNVPADIWDVRDRCYLPTLRPVPSDLDSRAEVPAVLDQGTEGTCTGHALAAVVNLLLQRQQKHRKKLLVSPRYLYEHARRHDEWKGENYEGSSIRGSLKGFFRHGACRDEDLPPSHAGPIPLEVYEKAESQALGAYFRVASRSVPDLQAALLEAGAVLVSAQTHEGWDVPSTSRTLPDITWTGREALQGGHAFALVGYDPQGFIIQNSWGPSWGRAGFARLTYEDWLTHGLDAWVLQLAACRASLVAGGSTSDSSQEQASQPHRLAVDQGAWSDHGPLATVPERDLPDLVSRMRTWGRGQAIPLVLLLSDALLDPTEHARLAAAWQHELLPHGLWPLTLAWRHGLHAEICELLGALPVPAPGSHPSQQSLDRALERRVHRVGRALWRDVKREAEAAVWGPDGKGGPAAHLLETLLESGLPLQVHLVGEGAGCQVLAHLLAWMRRQKRPVASVAIVAPALSFADFKRLVAPSVKGPEGAPWALFRGPGATLPVYSLGFLGLVSRSFEEQPPAPLLGGPVPPGERGLADHLSRCTQDLPPHAWAQAVPGPVADWLRHRC